MSFPKVRDITFNLLEEVGINAPPVRLEPVLEYFHASLVESDNIAESALLLDHGSWIIKVNPRLRPERRAFRIAHETGHIYWSDPGRHLGDPLLGGRLEKFCSKFASLLLCPHQWLVKDAPDADFDLFALKGIYSNISHEALAMRLTFLTHMLVAIYDNGKLYRRWASPGLASPLRGQELESEAYKEVDLYGSFRETIRKITWGGIERQVRLRGYPVFSGRFRRIILLMTPMGLEQADGDYPELEEDMPYPFPEY
ncbi:MAG: ImmA/IrrE family metallo-endopeptidase [Gemmatimonadota bacterium]|nr:ImmA/IrrE family metallo-endopeptidase [Gemmatimonadota bacterium]